MRVPFELMQSHLQKTWGDEKACPLCGTTEWVVNDTVFVLAEHEPVDGDTEYTFPVVPITCSNCLTAQFVSAVGLGLVPSAASEEDHERESAAGTAAVSKTPEGSS